MAVQISGNDITVPRDGSFTRNVTIGGTLTYEDVTNIDSVGLVTARNGIEIGARPGVAASISVDGNAIFSGITTFGGSGTGGSGTSTLTYDGNNLSQSIDAAAEGIQITGSGAHYGEISIDSNRTSSNQHVGTIKGSWNGTQVARIAFNTGSDTTNKDDGRILFSTSASGGTLANRAVIKEDGSIQLTSENTTGWLLDAGDDSASYTAIDNHFPTTNRTLYLNAETTHRSIAFWNKNGSDGYGFGLDNSGNFKVVYGTSERIRINSDGRVLIGDDTPENTIGLNARVQTFGTDASTSGIAIRRGSDDAQAAFLVMSKSRNTSVGSRTILQNGDEVGNIFFAADDGTDLISNTAAIKSQINGTPGANDTPGNLSFWTTSDGANSATQRMIIDSSGDLLLGTTSNGGGNRMYVVDSHTEAFVNPSDTILRIENADTSGTTGQASISFTTKTTGSNADSAIVSQAEDASGNSRLEFWTDTSNGMSEKMAITSAGVIESSQDTNVRTYEFAFNGSVGGSTTTQDIATLSNATSSTQAVAFCHYVSGYGIANNYIYGGATVNAIRRANSGTAWNAESNQNLNGGSSDAGPVVIGWDTSTGKLQFTCTAFVGYTIHVKLTVYNATCTINAL